MVKPNETLIHFIGIGGIGMSGIAEVLRNQGYNVSGSDLHASEVTRRLEGLGIKVFIGHAAQNVSRSNVVVISSSVKSDNPEVVEARRLQIPVIPRAEMLGELMRGKIGIAIAGSHGKTSTTSMTATVLSLCGLDPTLVIGGKVDSLGGNAKLGQSPYVVAEADESDGSFLHLPSTYSIVTNIDNDHLDHYGRIEAIEDAFVNFVAKVPFYGLAIVCGEDPRISQLLGRFTKPIVTYGFSRVWDFSAEDLKHSGLKTSFEVWHRARGKAQHVKLGRAEVNVPGKHNVLNATAALAMALELGISFDKASEALSHFKGVRRRFELVFDSPAREMAIVDDYGHHPTEIMATLRAAREYWKGRILTVFQPHRYSRTLHCREGFVSAFDHSDLTFLTDIYSAGEEPITGVHSRALVDSITAVRKTAQVMYSGDLDATKDLILREFRKGDLLLCLGAGSITRLPQLIAGEISK